MQKETKMTNKIITDITNFIFVSDKPEKVDVIFLPGGSHPAPAEYAAKLYKDDFAPLIFPSGGISIKHDKWYGVREKADVYNDNYNSDCEFLADVLIKNGVPQTSIVGEDKSRHTRDNAFLSKAKADELGLNIRKAIIVCKSFHARRCLMLYQLAFPDVEFLVCPVDCFEITKENWYTFDYGIDRVFGELTRCGNQFVDDIKNFLHNENKLNFKTLKCIHYEYT